MEKDFCDKLQYNDESSQDLCKKLINEFFNSFQFPSIANLDDIKESLIKDQRADFIRFYENYKNFARGPHKCKFFLCFYQNLHLTIDDLFADCMPNFLFDYFEKYLENLRRVQADEVNQIKVYLTQARAGEEMLRNKLQDQEA